MMIHTIWEHWGFQWCFWVWIILQSQIWRCASLMLKLLDYSKNSPCCSDEYGCLCILLWGLAWVLWICIWTSLQLGQHCKGSCIDNDLLWRLMLSGYKASYTVVAMWTIDLCILIWDNSHLAICLQVQVLDRSIEQDTNTQRSQILRDIVAVSALPIFAATFLLFKGNLNSFGTEALFPLSRNMKCYTHSGCSWSCPCWPCGFLITRTPLHGAHSLMANFKYQCTCCESPGLAWTAIVNKISHSLNFDPNLRENLTMSKILDL